LESKIASAADRALGLELEIFERLSAAVIADSLAIKQCAEALARLDVAARSRIWRPSATTRARRSTTALPS